MGTGEIIPSEAQPEEELIISAPDQPEDNAQPDDNPSNDDNDQQEQIFALYILVLPMKCRLRE